MPVSTLSVSFLPGVTCMHQGFIKCFEENFEEEWAGLDKTFVDEVLGRADARGA